MNFRWDLEKFRDIPCNTTERCMSKIIADQQKCRTSGIDYTNHNCIIFFSLKCIRVIPAALFYSELVASNVQHCLMYMPVGFAFPVDGEFLWSKDFLPCHVLFYTHFVTTLAFLVLCYT